MIVDNSQQSLTEKKCDDINKVIGVMEKSVLKGKIIHVSKPKSDIDKNCDKTKTSPVGTKSKSDMITVIDSSDDEEITEMDIIELQSPKESSKDKPLKTGKSSKSSSISDKINQIINMQKISSLIAVTPNFYIFFCFHNFCYSCTKNMGFF